jgi:hypothetical protein
MIVVLPTLLVIALVQFPDECRYEAERSAQTNASGATLLDLRADAGSLQVIGRPGLTEVRVRARACASSQALLEQLRVTANRSGSVVAVETAEIERDWDWSEEYARLDLVVEVPGGIAARMRDGSGEASVRGVGELDIEDGSGELRIEDVAGALNVDDGSGELSIRNVRGNVEILDGSGEIDVFDVTGSVTVRDGSGTIRVDRIGGSLRVLDDGSGQVEANGVGGDLEVRAGRFERIHYADVRGSVNLPPPRRRGRH